MKLIAWLFAVVTFPALASAQEKKDPPKDEELKCVTDQLEKAWGLKLKSMVVIEKPEGQGNVKITLEFTNDVTDVKALRTAFAGSIGIPLNFDNLPLVWFLFDEDNVSIAKHVVVRTEGDITGVKGDAFRLYLSIDPMILKKAKKLEARTPNVPKPKD